MLSEASDKIPATDASRLILGGHSFIGPLGADPAARPGEQADIVATCLEAGIRTVDTTYAPERLALGRAIAALPAARRPEVRPIIWNFFGPLDDPLPGPLPWTDERLALALAELAPWEGTPAVVIHSVGNADEDARQLQVVRSWWESGRIGEVGVWGDLDWAVGGEGLLGFVVAPFHPAAEGRTGPVFTTAHERGLLTLATSPFVRGWELERLANRLVATAGIDPGIARARMAAMLLRFTAHGPNVDRVIVAMRSASYVADNLAALRAGPLSRDETQWLRDFSAATEAS